MNLRFWFVPLMVGLGAAIGWIGPGHPSDIVFLSVGQGDCTLIRSGGMTIVIDAAAKNEYVDLGERLAVPALRKYGVQKIDLLLLTHPDSDHIGGLSALTKRWKIGAIGIPRHYKGHPSMETALKGVHGIEVKWIAPGSFLKSHGLEMELDFAPWRDGLPDNTGSLVVKLRSGKGTAVFMGDADAAAESYLAALGDWQAQILKAGHHGSRTSTSQLWLDEVHPQYFVASCGRNNNFGHPNPEVMNRAKSSGAKTLRTDIDGSVRFVLSPNGYVLATK